METYKIDVYRETDNIGLKGEIVIFCQNHPELNNSYTSFEKLAEDMIEIRNGRQIKNNNGLQFIFSFPFKSRSIIWKNNTIGWLSCLTMEEQERLFSLLK